MGDARRDRVLFVVVAIVLVFGACFGSRDPEVGPPQTESEVRNSADADNGASPDSEATTGSVTRVVAQPVAERSQDAAMDRATIRGTVRERETLRPVAGARVTVRLAVGGSPTEVESATDGRFEFASVPAQGKATIQAYLFFGKELAEVVLEDLKPGVVDVLLETAPRSVRSGIVIDAVTKEPIASAEIEVGRSIEFTRAAATSDAQGRFELLVSAEAESWSTELIVRAKGHVERHVMLANVQWPATIELTQSARIEGTVVGPDGGEIDGGAWLWGWRPLAEFADQNEVFPTTSKDYSAVAYDSMGAEVKGGRFVFDGALPHTRFRIAIQARTLTVGTTALNDECVTGAPGSTTSIHIQLLARQCKVVGRVVCAVGGTMTPVPKASVVVLQASRDQDAEVDEDGRFEVDGLVAGTAWIRAELPGVASSAPQEIRVAPGVDTTITLELPATAGSPRFKRRVRVDASGSDEFGLPEVRWRTATSHTWGTAAHRTDAWNDGTGDGDRSRHWIEVPEGPITIVAIEEDHYWNPSFPRHRSIGSASLVITPDDESEIVIERRLPEVGVLRVEYERPERVTADEVARRLFVRSTDPIALDGDVQGTFLRMTDRWTEVELPVGEYNVGTGEWWTIDPTAMHGKVSIAKGTVTKVAVPGFNGL